jgi:hypothetical protein
MGIEIWIGLVVLGFMAGFLIGGLTMWWAIRGDEQVEVIIPPSNWTPVALPMGRYDVEFLKSGAMRITAADEPTETTRTQDPRQPGQRQQ